MIDRFRNYISQKKLCRTGDRILLTVSGGVDSVVMLDLFVKAGYEAAVAHCNFHLRGVESDGDERFVVETAAAYGVDVFVKHFNTKEFARQNQLSIQVAARDLRYAWFEELRQKKNFDFIAVAHHADDRVETFFINLLRGSGLTGLKGISEKRGRIIRPLLFAERAEIENYARQNHMAYREDSSNKEDKYLRNKVRQQLLPRLKEMTDNYRQTVIASLDYLDEADQLLQLLLEEKFAGMIMRKEGETLIPLNELRQLHPLEIWIYYFLRRFDFNRDTTNNITAAVTHKQTGNIYSSASYKVLIDREYLLIRPVCNENNEEEYLITSETGETTIPLPLKWQTTVLDDNFQINQDTGVAQMNYDKLDFPLKIRKWQEGDKFKPLGMSGYKLISDYFIDNKINRFEKEKIWLLLSGKDIVWIIGHRMSDVYKITDHTKRVLTVSML